MVRVRVCNRQKVFAVDSVALRRTLQNLVRLAHNFAPKIGKWRELTVYLLDDGGIERINEMILGHEGVTDVITQRYSVVPGEPDGVIGEIFVNIECAGKIRTRRKNWSPDYELALYLAHGCNHLTGANDQCDASRRSMRRRELSWLRKLEPIKLFTNQI